MTSTAQNTSSQPMYCLDEITRRAARVALAGNDAVRVPYICQLSGASEEILLISRYAAERMVVATHGAIDIDEARVLAMVHIAKLCEQDIGELLHMSGTKAANILKDLMARNLAFAHTINGVTCYIQTDGEVRTQFTDLALGALSA
ncbi:hypothetical protein [Magnetovibrio sp.]|uniref:hypothetical protein n=1 Tax=Magnetovibrio sp. TaxID=2024836 RepID=UPI002F95B49D